REHEGAGQGLRARRWWCRRRRGCGHVVAPLRAAMPGVPAPRPALALRGRGGGRRTHRALEVPVADEAVERAAADPAAPCDQEVPGDRVEAAAHHRRRATWVSASLVEVLAVPLRRQRLELAADPAAGDTE